MKHELCDRYFIKYLKMCASIYKSTILIPFFGYNYYYYYKYLGKNIMNVKKIDVDDSNNVDYIAEYYIILYYSSNTTNENLCKNIIKCVKKYVLNVKQRDNIFKKCIELSNNEKYSIFKNSPILLDGKINKLNISHF